MKKETLLFALLSFLFFVNNTTNAQAPNKLWGRCGGGSLFDYSKSVSTDNSGNIFITGFFYSPFINIGGHLLNNSHSDSTSDVFLAKYDANGNMLWASSFGGTNYDEAYCVTTDPAGDVYMSGSFSNEISFGGITLSSNQTGFGVNIFIAKFDTYGTALWARSAGGSYIGDGSAYGCTCDGEGNVFITGYFQGKIVFGQDTLNSNFSRSMFLAKYDANGNYLWSKQNDRINDNAYAEATSAACDIGGDVFVTGSYRDTVLVGGYTLIADSGTEVFVVKYGAGGNVVWAESSHGCGSGYGGFSNSIASDVAGNTFITGFFQSASISFGNYLLTNSDPSAVHNPDIFIVGYNADGSVHWAKGVGNDDPDCVFGITTDSISNVFVTGMFTSSPVIFGNDTLITCGSGGDAFLVKYDAFGNEQWATNFCGNVGAVVGGSVSTDAIGNIYVTGYFDAPVFIFGNDTLRNCINDNNPDVYLVKFDGSSPMHIDGTDDFISHNPYPNPATDKLNIDLPLNAVIEIFSLDGQLLTKIQNNRSGTTIDLSSFPAGVFIVKATTDKGLLIKEFIKK